MGLLTASAVALLAVVLFLWAADVPLGIPGEWVWERLPADAQSFANLILAAITAGAYLLFVVWGDRRLARPTIHVAELVLWLIGLGVAGFFWLATVQDTAPLAGQLGKAPFVLYYPGSSGYFTHARYESSDAVELLRGYDALMRRGDVLHQGTHPPGLFLAFHGLIAMVDRQPWLIDVMRSSEPESVREAFNVVAENAARTPQPLLPADRAVLWLATLLAMTAAAATVWPLYSLLRCTLDHRTAWIGAATWPAVPAVAIFLPKSDAIFPLLACGSLAALAWSVRHRSFWRGGIAGLILFLGLFCSLAFLPIALFGALGVFVTSVRRAGWRQGLVEMWPTVIGVGVGLVIPILLLRVAFGLNMLTVWGWNYHNHAGFYGQFTRTYWKWLLINPVELAIAVGTPVGVAAWWGLPQQWRFTMWTTADVLTAIAGVVWALLWLSGKNAGEAARLWVLLMPGAVWIAAHGLQRSGDLSRWRWIWLALQLAASLATVHRVAGFHLG